jgi:hypothetical protein
MVQILLEFVVDDLDRRAPGLFFAFLLTIRPIYIIARALRSCRFPNKLPEGIGLTLDGVMLGDNAPECVYFVDVAREEELGIVELGLELVRTGAGSDVDCWAGSVRSWVVGGRT